MIAAPSRARPLLVVALAGFFVVVQFYTSFAALSPTPPVGYVFAGRAGAALLISLLVLAAAVCCVRLARDRRMPSRTSLTILALWIGPALLSALLGLDPLSGLQVVAIMLLGAGFHLALVRWYPHPPVARAVLGSYLSAGIVAAAAALVMLAVRRPAPLWAYNHGRAAGFFVTANQFAAFLVAYVFVALGVMLAVREPWLRVLGGIGTALGLVALGATFSQSGWLGVLVAGALLSFWLGARRLALGLAVLAVAAALLAFVRPAAYHNPADSVDRLRTWRAGLRVVELFPLTGVGPMAYWRVYPEVRPPNGDEPGTFGALHPHNAYLSLAGETGLAGAVAFLAGWAVFGAAVRRGLAGAGKARKQLALALCAALAGTLVQGLFDTIGVVELTFVWIPYTALALAVARYGLPRAEALR
ncbi:MAG: O-antigen ligase family protein [Vulcanimicrobiaceae bacterium]